MGGLHKPMNAAEDVAFLTRREIEKSIAAGNVSFAQQFSARYAAFWLKPRDQARITAFWLKPRDQAWITDTAPDAAEKFADTHGGIEGSLYSPEFPAGVARTRDQQVFAQLWLNYLDFETTDARALLADVDRLRDRVDIYLGTASS